LSACQTGLGDQYGDEGVYGLARAFKIAGVRYVVVSLWQVDDAATKQLMTFFYRHYLQGNLPVHEALRAAQADMRKTKEYNKPYYWAGFVVMD
jgi:CHAT domain-containing protein